MICSIELLYTFIFNIEKIKQPEYSIPIFICACALGMCLGILLSRTNKNIIK